MCNPMATVLSSSLMPGDGHYRASTVAPLPMQVDTDPWCPTEIIIRPKTKRRIILTYEWDFTGVEVVRCSPTRRNESVAAPNPGEKFPVESGSPTPATSSTRYLLLPRTASTHPWSPIGCVDKESRGRH
jgi:hypothetical protein